VVITDGVTVLLCQQAGVGYVCSVGRQWIRK